MSDYDLSKDASVAVSPLSAGAPGVPSWPKISVVTPSYNQAQFLEETIRSVIEQGYPNLEYLVIDGGSSDGSLEIIKKYADKLTFWESERDRGQCHAINKGFARATGEILGWLNSDDTLEPGCLERVGRYFLDHAEWCAITGGTYAIDENGRYVDAGTFELLDGTRPNRSIRRCLKSKGSDCLSFWSRDWFPQPATFWRKDLWNKVGPLDESWNYSMDYALWRRMAKFTEIHPVDEVLGNYRYHRHAKCMLDTWAPMREVIAINAAEMSDSQFKQFSLEVMDWLLEQIASQQRGKTAAQQELSGVLRSSTYRIGRLLLRPFSWLKRVSKV